MTHWSTIPPPTPEDFYRWQRRRRSPIARVGRRGRRQRDVLDGFRRAVELRAHGLCEGQRAGICRAMPHYGSDAHHIFPADRSARIQDPARGVFLCRDAHRWVHENPETARSLGLLRVAR